MEERPRRPEREALAGGPPLPTPPPPGPFASRAGAKLHHALDAFGIAVEGRRCVDLGCSTGGFTDCLLRAGAASVIAIDTGYGVLAWRLRQDPRVIVRERTNALHAQPGPGEHAGLVVVDLGWTPQRLAVPAALRWLAPGGRIVTLIKPHYELSPDEARTLLQRGVLDDADAEWVAQRTVAAMPSLGVIVDGVTPSPVRGVGKGGGKHARGNLEWLTLLRASDPRA